MFKTSFCDRAQNPHFVAYLGRPQCSFNVSKSKMQSEGYWSHLWAVPDIPVFSNKDKRFKCLWARYGSRCQAHRFVSRTATRLGFSMCIKIGPQPKGHPASLTKQWDALESTSVSITVEHFRHLVESMPRPIWVWSEKQLNITNVFLMYGILSVFQYIA
jgi:hypothetical protein